MKELTNGQTSGAEITVAPGSLLEAIARVAADPQTNIEVMERLLAMQMQLLADQRMQAFATAMNRLQKVLPQMTKAGTTWNKPDKDGKKTVRWHYALIEDIDTVIRPLYTDEGFSVSFNEEQSTGNIRKFSMTVLHADGHSKTLYKTMPLDVSDYRTAAQSENSTTSLARQQLLKMHFNLVARGEDDDGQGGVQCITDEQALDLETLITEVGANRAAYLKWLGVVNVSDILDKDHKKAVNGLEEKRRKHK